jgi:hypothetical protein
LTGEHRHVGENGYGDSTAAIIATMRNGRNDHVNDAGSGKSYLSDPRRKCSGEIIPRLCIKQSVTTVWGFIGTDEHVAGGDDDQVIPFL